VINYLKTIPRNFKLLNKKEKLNVLIFCLFSLMLVFGLAYLFTLGLLVFAPMLKFRFFFVLFSILFSLIGSLILFILFFVVK